MREAMTSAQDFINEIDMKFNADVFTGSKPISRDTSSTVTYASIFVEDFLRVEAW